MAKRIFGLVLLLLISCFFAAESYTVIFRNGKTMEGTVVSETDEILVFKDLKGLQYSLKKRMLDLEKMAAANVPPPVPLEESTIADEPPATTPSRDDKKDSKVYTAKDIEALREKYGELTTDRTTAGGDDDELSAGDNSPAGVHSRLQAAATRVSEVMSQIDGYISGMTTAWEVASSTGGNSEKAVQTFRAKQADSLSAIQDNVADLSAAKDALLAVPADYKGAIDALAFTITRLDQAISRIQEHNNSQNPTTLRNRVAEVVNEIQPKLNEITSVPAPAAPEDAPEEGETEEEEGEEEPPPPGF